MPFKARGSGSYASRCIMPAETLITTRAPQCIGMQQFSNASELMTMSKEVVITVEDKNCLPSLLYGIELCPVNASDISSLDFVVKRVHGIVSDL